MLNYLGSLVELLSVGVIPAILLIATLILALKIAEMNRTMDSRVAQTALKKQREGLEAIRERKLQDKKNQIEDKLAAKGTVNHLRERVARLKAADDEIKNRYKE